MKVLAPLTDKPLYLAISWMTKSILRLRKKRDVW
jgi:hypothetical protein